MPLGSISSTENKQTNKQTGKAEPGVVAQACNPSIWEAETGGSGFAASLGYLVRLSAT